MIQEATLATKIVFESLPNSEAKDVEIADFQAKLFVLV
jgi:hypothetical protein